MTITTTIAHAAPSAARVHALDHLRALAMLAGVLFHAALAYSPLLHPWWPAADRQHSPVVDALVEWGAQWSFGERKRSEIPVSN